MPGGNSTNRPRATTDTKNKPKTYFNSVKCAKGARNYLKDNIQSVSAIAGKTI